MSVAPQRRRAAAALAFVVACLAASCASPPLTIYTLGAPGVAADAAPLGRKTTVIEVRRVAIPDYLDSQDILVRDGNVLVRSTRGRWATRVSLEATYFLTSELARLNPGAVVTDQPQVEPPAERIFVTISRLDVTSAGTATLEADWQVVPGNPAQPVRRGRAQFTSSGPVATDQDVVSLTKAVLAQLAGAISATGA